jgi:hypothetical protein
MLLNGSFGSKTEVTAPIGEVCFSPNSGQIAALRHNCEWRPTQLVAYRATPLFATIDADPEFIWGMSARVRHRFFASRKGP